MLKEFRTFLFRGNVVDLAVAVVIGAAFKSIVDALVSGIITPLIGSIVSTSFEDMTFKVNGSKYLYGTVISAAISFVAVAAVIFFLIVKPMQVLAERRRRGEPTEDTLAPSDEAILLTEIRDLLAAQR